MIVQHDFRLACKVGKIQIDPTLEFSLFARSIYENGYRRPINILIPKL